MRDRTVRIMGAAEVGKLLKTMEPRRLTIQDIADELDINYRTAQKRLWRLGIEPVETIGRNNLYDRSVIKTLSHHPGK